MLAGFFSILLCPEKVEMIRRPSSVTDCQAVTNRFGEIRFGRLYCVVHRFAQREMGCDGLGEGAAGPMGVGGIDEFSLEHIEESAVVEQIGRSICR